jgi:hypothetical protein
VCRTGDRRAVSDNALRLPVLPPGAQPSGAATPHATARAPYPPRGTCAPRHNQGSPVLKNVGEPQSVQDSGRHTYVLEVIPRVLRPGEADPLHFLLPPSRAGRPDSTHALDLLLLALLALQVLRQLRAVEQTIPRVVSPSKIDDSGTAMDRLAPIH